MATVRIEIKEPIWYGGRRQVGIAEYKLRGCDTVEVVIGYRNRYGDLVYPRPLRIPVSKVLRGRRQERKGVVLRWVAIDDMVPAIT